MQKKNLFIWSLYDFANSLLNINLLLYFSQWIIVDNNLPEFWYGGVFSLSTLLLLVTSPIIGVYTDRLKRKLPILLWASIIIGASALLLSAAATALPVPSMTTALIALALYFIVIYFYQASLVVFNALIPTLSGPAHIGRTSGWGEFANNAGLIAGIFLTLPLIQGSVKLFGASGRSQVFLPSTLAFLLLMVPFFLFFRESRRSGVSTMSLGILSRRAIELIRSLPSFPPMLWFLVGFYFVSDAVRTVLLFFPLYFQKVWGLEDSKKAIVTVFILVAMMVGSVIGGYAADRWGTRRTLLWCVFFMILILVAVLTFSTLTLGAWVTLGSLGISWGGYFAVSRSFLIHLSPKGHVGEYFGLYNLFERFASVVAPLVWSTTVAVFAFLGPADSYRAAGTVSAVLIFIGLLFFLKVKESA